MRAAGLAVAFCGSSLQSLGVLLQKKAQNDLTGTVDMMLGSHIILNAVNTEENEEENEEDEAEEDEEDDLDYVKSRVWRLGFAVQLAGSVLVFTSLAWIGPALMVIVASFGLVVNLVLSPPILGEYRTWKDWVSVCFIVAGISLAITAVESANDHPELTPDEVLGQMSTPQAGIAWGVLAGLFLALFLVVRLPKNKPAPELNITRFAFVTRASVSGTLGVMLATPTSILIQAPAHAPGILWLAAVAMVIQVVLDIHVQNRSLKFNDVMFHVPASFVMFQIFSLAGGAIIFQTINGFDTQHFIMGGVGVGLTIIGVVFSSWRPFPGSPGYMVIQPL